MEAASVASIALLAAVALCVVLPIAKQVYNRTRKGTKKNSDIQLQPMPITRAVVPEGENRSGRPSVDTIVRVGQELPPPPYHAERSPPTATTADDETVIVVNDPPTSTDPGTSHVDERRNDRSSGEEVPSAVVIAVEA